MATATTEAKIYTKEEIAAFTGVQLEGFAKKLSWRDTRYGAQHSRYENAGFPINAYNTRINSRRDYLVRRLQMARQSSWNPAAAAAKPRITFNVTTELLLKDCRPKGRKFKIELVNDSVKLQQVDRSGSYGDTFAGDGVCDAKASIKLETFKRLIELLKTSPPATTATEGLIIATAIVVKEGSHHLAFRTAGKIVMVTQNSEIGSSQERWWHFNISDLERIPEALEVMNSWKVTSVPNLPEITETTTLENR